MTKEKKEKIRKDLVKYLTKKWYINEEDAEKITSGVMKIINRQTKGGDMNKKTIIPTYKIGEEVCKIGYEDEEFTIIEITFKNGMPFYTLDDGDIFPEPELIRCEK